jgi:hypothetical protein
MPDGTVTLPQGLPKPPQCSSAIEVAVAVNQ